MTRNPFLRLAIFLRLIKRDRFERMERIEREAAVRTQDVRQRNDQDVAWFRASGLDLPNLNATLFDARMREGGK